MESLFIGQRANNIVDLCCLLLSCAKVIIKVLLSSVQRERYGGQTIQLYRGTSDCHDKKVLEIKNIDSPDMASESRESPEAASFIQRPLKVFGITFAPLSMPFQRRLQVNNLEVSIPPSQIDVQPSDTDRPSASGST